MRMKYFKVITTIKHYYKDILMNIHNPNKYSIGLLKTWNITMEDKELIEEESAVIDYLISLKVGLAYNQNTEKPKAEIAFRCFNRYLEFLKLIFNCNETNYKKCDALTSTSYLACVYYLEKFKDADWLDNLPKNVLTYQNKYKNKKQ